MARKMSIFYGEEKYFTKKKAKELEPTLTEELIERHNKIKDGKKQARVAMDFLSLKLGMSLDTQKIKVDE